LKTAARRSRWVLPVLLGAAGCLFRADAPPRYFQPESRALGAVVASDGRVTGAAGRRVRLRHVQAAPHLHERMVWRVSEVEFGYYEQRRWSEAPASYVQRALTYELFGRRGLRPGMPGKDATLDVKVLAFEELRAPAHEVSVVTAVRLADPSAPPVLEQRFEVRRPVPDDDPGSVARVAGQALDELIEEVGTAVEAALPVEPPVERRRG
jgi:ABC-type uncharacterized transport system auxiliary subunit